MFVFGNLLVGLAQALDMALQLYMLVLFARAVVSWVSADPRNPIVRFLVMAVDPLTRRIRGFLPASLRYFPLDIAFLVLLGLVIFARFGIVPSILEAGLRLR